MNMVELLILSVPATLGIVKLGFFAVVVALAARGIFQAYGQPSTVPATLTPPPRYPHRTAS